MRALIDFVHNAGIQTDLHPMGLNRHQVRELFGCFVACLDDYAIDNRGDVGSWVRQAAIIALERITYFILNHRLDFYTLEMGTEMFCGLIHQSLEKIDRIRKLAGQAIERLLSFQLLLPFVPHGPYLIQLLK